MDLGNKMAESKSGFDIETEQKAPEPEINEPAADVDLSFLGESFLDEEAPESEPVDASVEEAMAEIEEAMNAMEEEPAKEEKPKKTTKKKASK